jgi:cation transport regulator ChaC
MEYKMPSDDEPHDVLATKRADLARLADDLIKTVEQLQENGARDEHLARLADELHRTVEQLQENGARDEERRKQQRRAAGIGPPVIEHERRTGTGRRNDDRESPNAPQVPEPV